MKFSIILSTLNRSELVGKAITSIFNQNYEDYEIIIIDQSDNDKTEEIIKNINSKNIFYYRVKFKGLSRARNFGIDKSSGQYICLMDDDAEYEENFLNLASEILSNENYHALSGLIKEKETNKVFMPVMSEFDNRIIDYDSISVCLSASLVIKKSILVDIIGKFDERMGVGAYFGSAEETDLLIRFLNQDFKIFYTQRLIVYHPYPISDISEDSYKKAYTYGLGEGALCKKLSRNKKTKIIFIKRFSKNIIKTSLAIIIYVYITDKRNFYIGRLKGLARGFYEYN